MNKRFRYGLILVGFIFFIIASPIIVLYVRGISYDFTAKQFVRTGLLAVRAEPKDLSILLDGKKMRQGPGDIKFLVPKEYEITLSAPGYQDWTKHLRISAGQVTWIGNNSQKTYLLKKNSPAAEVSENVRDFCLAGTTVYQLSESSVSATSEGSQNKQMVLELPGEAERLSCSDDGTIILAEGKNGSYGLSFAKKTVTDLSKLLPSGAEFSIYKNTLYGFSDESVFSITLHSGEKNMLADHVAFFSATDSFLYYVTSSLTQPWLEAKNLSSKAVTPIIALPPGLQNGTILVTDSRSVFLQSGPSLYRVGAGLETLSRNANEVGFSGSSESLIVNQSGEIDRYNPATGQWTFVTRDSAPASHMTERDDIGYTFEKKGNSLAAIELDNRDKSNEYLLYSGEHFASFAINQDGTAAYVLDGQTLKKIMLR